MIEFKAKSILKVPGVRIEHLTKVHALIDETWDGQKNHLDLLSAKYEPQPGTYTIEIAVPISGHDPDKYESGFHVDRALPLKLFEALGIYPETKK